MFAPIGKSDYNTTTNRLRSRIAGEDDMAREPMSVRLTDDARHLLTELSAELGVSKSDVIELAIREKAWRAHDDSWASTPEFRARLPPAMRER